MKHARQFDNSKSHKLVTATAVAFLLMEGDADETGSLVILFNPKHTFHRIGFLGDFAGLVNLVYIMDITKSRMLGLCIYGGFRGFLLANMCYIKDS